MLYRHEKPWLFKKSNLYMSLPLLQPYRISNHLPLYGLRVQSKCIHCYAYQTWNFPIPSITFRCFMFVSSKHVYETLFPWVDHGILDLLKDPSFYSCSLSPSVQLSQNHEGRNSSFMITWINLFKTEDYRELLKIVEDRCYPSLFSYLGISGSRFLQGG
jgi:hypothetical protein